MLKPPKIFLSIFGGMLTKCKIPWGILENEVPAGMGIFIFQNATHHFFLLIPTSIMGKKSDEFLNSVMPLEPGEFWKEALFSSTSGACLLLELSAPRALPYTEPTPDRQYARRNCEYICSYSVQIYYLLTVTANFKLIYVYSI
jgi:hypothetical protein